MDLMTIAAAKALAGGGGGGSGLPMTVTYTRTGVGNELAADITLAEIGAAIMDGREVRGVLQLDSTQYGAAPLTGFSMAEGTITGVSFSNAAFVDISPALVQVNHYYNSENGEVTERAVFVAADLVTSEMITYDDTTQTLAINTPQS